MVAAAKEYSDIFHYLLSLDIDMDQQVTSGRFQGFTALMFAAYIGRSEIVKILLKQNPNLNIKEQLGRSALDLAVQKNHQDIVQTILAT